MQIDVENMLTTMVLNKKELWKDKEIRETFPFLFIWESTKKIPIWNCPKNQLIIYKSIP
jgi:hypothetical protein